jgi:hypothetical protein
MIISKIQQIQDEAESWENFRDYRIRKMMETDPATNSIKEQQKMEATTSRSTRSTAAAKTTPPLDTPAETITPRTTRSKAAVTLAGVATANKDAAISATKLQAGKMALSVLKQQIVPRLPMWMQGYAEGPMADIVLANLVNLAVMWNLHRGNSTIEQLRDAMMVAAMNEAIESFNPTKFISDFLLKMKATDPTALDGFDK